MASKTNPLETLFKELDRQIQDGDYQNAVSTCDKILISTPNDPDATRCKVVALIQLGKFDKSLEYINTIPNGSVDYLFEKAYSLYRLKQFNETLSLIKKAQEPVPVRVLQLEAQVHYRLEDFDKSTEVYKKILDDSKVDSIELKTNLCAAYVYSTQPKGGESVISYNKSAISENFEFAYNCACLAIENGDLNNAQKYLKSAEDICNESLKEEGLADEDKEDILGSLSNITTQLAYVYQIQNKVEEASQLYQNVLKSKDRDETAVAVASNNVVVIKQEHDLFDSFKKLKQANSQTLEQKLTSHQKKVILFNRCLVLLHMNKLDQCREQIKIFQDQFPTSDRIPLLSAALLMKEKKGTKSEELLKSFATEHPEDSLLVQLSLAQIYLSKGNTQGAISILEGISTLRSRPVMLATLVSLYEQSNQVDSAMKAWDEYCNYLANQKNKDEDEYLKALKENANFKLKHKKFKEAAAMFEKVIKINQNDLEALPGLIIAYSQFDPKLAEKYDRLPRLNNEVEVDAEALENLAAPKLKNKDKEEIVSKNSEKIDKEKKKKKKKKKKLLPKNFDPTKLPDPERWVAIKERSGYKKKTKRGKLEKGPQGTQSVPVQQRAGYDKSQIKEEKKEVTTPSTPTSSTSSTSTTSTTEEKKENKATPPTKQPQPQKKKGGKKKR